MSENYIRNHFDDIKKYGNVIENRLDDENCIQNFKITQTYKKQKLSPVF